MPPIRIQICNVLQELLHFCHLPLSLPHHLLAENGIAVLSSLNVGEKHGYTLYRVPPRLEIKIASSSSHMVDNSVMKILVNCCLFSLYIPCSFTLFSQLGHDQLFPVLLVCIFVSFCIFAYLSQIAFLDFLPSTSVCSECLNYNF